jgi:glutamate N-acetyltransferase/amino-acid N-acetyltransferase
LEERLVIELDLEGTVTSALGFKAGAMACGLKESGGLDLALLHSDHDCTAAGVFTKNQVVAAPVTLDHQTLAANKDHIRGLVANAGMANACTGDPGMAVALEMQRSAAGLFDERPEQFFVLSTGVIGVQIPLEKVIPSLALVAQELSAGKGLDLARAIMTTDTRPKHLAVKVFLNGREITIGGVAKGSGMIHPDMATMLGLITTDAAIPADALQELLQEAVNQSFNCISVDGDTSTNDTVLLLANGASGHQLEDETSLALFAEGLNTLCIELAKSIVRDGEGAGKFVEIQVTGASEAAEAKAIAGTIATSPLVKTALAGSDPNWGRILAAAGRAGVYFDQGQVALWIGNPGEQELQIVDQGTPTGYLEEDAAAIFARLEINIRLHLGQGKARANMWTTDLSHDYVTINADYRT